MCIPIYLGGAWRGSYARNSLYGELEQDSLEDLSLLEVSAKKFLEQSGKYSYKMARPDGACPRVPKETQAWNDRIINYAV